MAPEPTRHRRGSPHRPVQPQRDPRLAGHGVLAPGGRRPVGDRAGVAPRGGGPGRDGAGRRLDGLHRRRPPGRGRDRARQRGVRADRSVVGGRRDGGAAADARASPTASTSRSPPPSCCTRQGDSATSGRQTEAMPSFDFVIIGAGPAGEGAAHKARQLGATVAVVDRRWFGGSCPHIGCVPSKALLYAAQRHACRRGLLVAARVGTAGLHGQPPGRCGRARRHIARPLAREGRGRDVTAARAASRGAAG